MENYSLIPYKYFTNVRDENGYCYFCHVDKVVDDFKFQELLVRNSDPRYQNKKKKIKSLDDLIRENTQNIKVEKVSKFHVFSKNVVKIAPPILIEINEPEECPEECKDVVEEVPHKPTEAEHFLKLMALHPNL